MSTRTVYDYIVSFWLRYGYSPSIREIGKGCGISSTSVVKFHLDKLKSSGDIRYVHNISRSITVVGSQWLPPK